MKWAITLLTLLTLPLLFNSVPLEVLRLKTFDALVTTPEPTGHFTILNIDEQFLDDQGGYPLPRETLAKIHNDIINKGALGVGWVMLFPHADRMGGDDEFSKALQSSPSVIAMPEVNNGNYPKTVGTVIKGPIVSLPKAQGFLENIEPLKQSANQGAISAPVDVDNLVRRIPLLQQTNNGWVASFGTEVLKILGGGQTYQVVTNLNGIEQVRVKGIPPITTDSLGRKWISWVNTPQTTLEELDVANKFVFVGFTAKGISPQLATPVGLLEPHKIQTALSESMLMDTPQIPDYRLVVELLLLIISGALTAFLINYLNITLGVVAVLFLVLLTSSLGYYLITLNYLIDVTWSIISIIFISTQQFYLNFRTQYKLRQQIKKQFEHYLDPRQVKQLQDNPELLKLGGERRRCTFLFTDVRGFTSLSERLEPEQVTEIMNKALTIQANAVKKYDGMVDKYIGDAMMAIFNAPIDVPDHENKAIQAALQIHKDMQEANLGIEIGIGINTGEAVVGNMGSDTRFDYSAIGDAVNLAARLESSTKEIGEDIVIGYNTAIKSAISLSLLKPIYVKGKEKSVQVFKVSQP
ncbi:adenylate/guanylate cyclase domain-containing protein [Gammaproteobacteria bacterium]|nr:adenylate/guanylate cyclase domain-containing protein [Gammaproteobacteria bacterium]